MIAIRIIVLLGIIFLGACNNEEPVALQEKRKVPVKVIVVREEERDSTLKLLGVVEANREMKVGFKISGKLEALPLEEGQFIARGTTMARLDRTELLARREKAFENRNKAKRDLERMERLYRNRTVAESAFQDAGSALNAADAELKIVDDLLKNSLIRAPFSGLVIKKLSETGEVVGAGDPVALLAEVDPIQVKASVPDPLVARIRKGQEVKVHTEARPQETFLGKVLRLEPAADPLSRTFRVVVRIENPETGLRPGLIVRARILEGKRRPAIYIPMDAVLAFGTNPAVFVVKDARAERRPIVTGAILGSEVEIKDGLAQGERVIVVGQEYLKDQQAVLIEKKGSETN